MYKLDKIQEQHRIENYIRDRFEKGYYTEENLLSGFMVDNQPEFRIVPNLPDNQEYYLILPFFLQFDHSYEPITGVTLVAEDKSILIYGYQTLKRYYTND